jgi:hypothetical protein
MQVTIANLVSATPQQVFDTIRTHLLTQREKCHDGHGNCQYRADGRMCAAGVLLKDVDDDIVETYEGMNWETLVEDRHVPKAHYNLIFSLQIVHDVHSPEHWEEELKEVARTYELHY